MLKRFFVAVTMAVSLLSTGLAQAATPETTLALTELMDGNARFVNGTMFNLQAKSNATTRQQTGLAQHPFAIVLDCSDSRLSPEILFDQGLGQVFVVRVAGNVIAPHEIASIEYAIEHLAAKLVVIMGHERCGAVSAAYGVIDAAGAPIGTPAVPGPPAVPGTGYYSLTPDLQVLVSDIGPSVAATKTAGGSVTDCVLHNTNAVATALQARSELLLNPVVRAEVSIVEAFYDIDNGQVTVTAIDGVPTATPATSVHTVIASAGAGGTIAPAGTSAVETGASQPYFITPAAGFAVSQILVNGSPIALPVSNPYLLADNGANQTISVSFTAVPNPNPPAGAPAWVGAQLQGNNGDVKVWWPLSATAGATYNVLADGVAVASGVAGTSVIINLPNGPHTITVQAVATGYAPNAGSATASVTVNKVAAAPAWLGVQKSGTTVKLWWPSVATPGASYEITETGPGAPTVYTTANATFQTSGGLTYVLLSSLGKTAGSYTYSIRTLAGGYNASASVPGSAAVPLP